MTTLYGKWYDGKTSAETPAILRVLPAGDLLVQGADAHAIFCRQPAHGVRFSDRMADTPRSVTFPDGAVFETGDNDAVDRLLAAMRAHRRSRWVHALESHRRSILAALLIVLLIAAALVRWGIPAAAQTVAAFLPASFYAIADRQTLALLDRAPLGPSKLPQEVHERVRRHLEPIIADHPRLGLHLVFRRGGRLGPNAFALPGGTIVFTDEMVEIAAHDDELMAVMAHETGHVAHRHGMRRMVQDSLLSFAVMALTGDASGVAELFLGLPVVLTELAYSRGFEREADRYALDYLTRSGVPPSRFADILERIAQRQEHRPRGQGPGWTGYLATHPSTAERILAFRGAAPSQ